jgi:hypothetical protein
MHALIILVSIGSLGLACSILTLIAMHALPAGVHALGDPVCFYATSGLRPLFWASSLGMGASALCLAIRLGLVTGLGSVSSDISLGALCTFALSRLAIVFFPADRGPRTVRGAVHVVLDVLTFTGISTAAFLTTKGLAPLGWGLGQGWAVSGSLARISAITTIVFAWLTVPVISIPSWRRWTGLNERCLFASFLAWLVAAYLPLLH